MLPCRMAVERIARLVEGDVLGQRDWQLIERHADRGFALALRILKNADDADDVVQDSFLKLWTHRKRMEIGRAKFSTWLYRVITNRCIDLRRKPAMDDIETVPEVADETEDALSRLHRASMTSLLEAALSRLPDQQRIAAERMTVIQTR